MLVVCKNNNIGKEAIDFKTKNRQNDKFAGIVKTDITQPNISLARFTDPEIFLKPHG